MDMPAATSKNSLVRWHGINNFDAILSASWGKAGYPSIFTIGNSTLFGGKQELTNTLNYSLESTFEDSNKYIHSGNESV